MPCVVSPAPEAALSLSSAYLLTALRSVYVVRGGKKSFGFLGCKLAVLTLCALNSSRLAHHVYISSFESRAKSLTT